MGKYNIYFNIDQLGNIKEFFDMANKLITVYKENDYSLYLTFTTNNSNVDFIRFTLKSSSNAVLLHSAYLTLMSKEVRDFLKDKAFLKIQAKGVTSLFEPIIKDGSENIKFSIEDNEDGTIKIIRTVNSNTFLFETFKKEEIRNVPEKPETLKSDNITKSALSFISKLVSFSKDIEGLEERPSGDLYFTDSSISLINSYICLKKYLASNITASCVPSEIVRSLAVLYSVFGRFEETEIRLVPVFNETVQIQVNVGVVNIICTFAVTSEKFDNPSFDSLLPKGDEGFIKRTVITSDLDKAISVNRDTFVESKATWKHSNVRITDDDKGNLIFKSDAINATCTSKIPVQYFEGQDKMDYPLSCNCLNAFSVLSKVRVKETLGETELEVEEPTVDIKLYETHKNGGNANIFHIVSSGNLEAIIPAIAM